MVNPFSQMSASHSVHWINCDRWKSPSPSQRWQKMSALCLRKEMGPKTVQCKKKKNKNLQGSLRYFIAGRKTWLSRKLIIEDSLQWTRSLYSLNTDCELSVFCWALWAASYCFFWHGSFGDQLGGNIRKKRRRNVMKKCYFYRLEWSQTAGGAESFTVAAAIPPGSCE